MKNSKSLLILRKIAVLAAIFLLYALPASADDWQPITQDDLKLTSEQAGNAEAIILYHELTSDDVRKHRIEYIRIKILTEKGKRYADVEVPYHSRGEFGTHIIDLKARTIAPDGTITHFSGEVFDKTVVKGHGLTVREKTFTFPGVQVGSIIEYRYTEYWSDGYVRAPTWILQERLAQKKAKFSYTPIQLDFNHYVQKGNGDVADGVYYIEVGLPKNASVKRSPRGILELEMTSIPAYEEEEFSPPVEAMKMRVHFYYGNSKMLKPDEFWREQGKHWDKDVEKFMGHSSAVAKAALQAISGANTTEEKVRKIYAAVQAMKSITSQDFLEELASSGKINTSAEQALAQKSGTHNDLTRLFVAMVRSQNIPAFLMRVATREQTFFQVNIPDEDQLNSEVAIVSVDGKEIFLDPGTRLCPFELLDWKRTMVQGLRQRAGGGTEMSQTPAPTYADAVRQRIADLKLERDGSVKGTIVLFWMGQEALQRRIEGSETDEAGRKKAAEDELKSQLSGGAVVKLTSLTGSDDPDQQLKATFTVELPGFATGTGKRLLLPSELFLKRQAFVHSERKTPVYFEYPYRLVEKVTIALPSDVQVENLPQSTPVQADYAICKVTRTASGSVLEVRRDFAINGISFPLAEYPKLKSFFEKVHANDDEQVTLRTTPVAASK